MDAKRQAGRRVPVIGLTGGIAAGKSTVSARLRRLGAHVIDADAVGHRVLEPEGEAYGAVVEAFGRDILDDAGRVDRRRLGARVFAHEAQRRRLNAISHPLMARRMAAEIREVRARVSPPPAIVLDAAILFEAGWDALCDQVWTVSAPSALAERRLVADKGLAPDEARRRIAAQLSNAEREARAHRVIPNDGTLAELEAAVDAAWAEETGRGA